MKMRGGMYKIGSKTIYRMIDVDVEERSDRIYFSFPFNNYLKDQIKAMTGARFDWESKTWSVAKTNRNLFRIDLLKGINRYEPYDRPLLEIDVEPRVCFKCHGKGCQRCNGTGRIRLYEHQVEMFRFGLTRRQCIIAADLGVGKTLTAIEIIDYAHEHEGLDDVIYVGPRSALAAVRLEFERWNSKVDPRFYTYEGLKGIAEYACPQILILDEMSRVKTITAQRTQAAQMIADRMREKYGHDAYIIGLTGTPAPKSPLDWYSLAEIACVTDDTWIFTDQGPRQVYQLLEKEVNVVVDNKIFKTEGFFKTGNKEVFELVTKEGYKLKATADHKILANYHGVAFWTQLSKLQSGDKVYLHNHEDIEWGIKGTFEEGYILGWLIGDGNISVRKSGNLRNTLYFFKKDHSVLDYIIDSLKDANVNYSYSHECFRIESKNLNKLVYEYSLDKNKEINNIIESASSDFIEGLLSAFFDADGYVDVNGNMIELVQSNLPRLEAVQRLLLCFGIKSIIRKMSSKTIEMINQNGRNQPYRLRISNFVNLMKFEERVDFKIDYKRENLTRLINKRSINRKLQNEDFLVTMDSITSIGYKDVYDITVPEINAFSGNGFYLHNCPGYLLEGTINKFKNRLAIVQMKESPAGGVFPELVSWKDNEEKCDVCGKLPNDFKHNIVSDEYHNYKPSVNEVKKLYNRLKGLVIVKKKSECLDLPELRHEIIRLEPSLATLNAVEILKAKSARAIQFLTHCREISDGFLYQEAIEGKTTCQLCEGSTKVSSRLVPKGKPICPECSMETVPGLSYCEECGAELFDNQGQVVCDNCGQPTSNPDEPCLGCGYQREKQIESEATLVDCPRCNGTGIVDRIIRTTNYLDTPKDGAIIQKLGEHEDVGRLVIYAGFKGSIDKLVGLCKKQGWTTIKVDGRGWYSDIAKSDSEMVRAFQDSDQEKIVFIAHPKSGGMGLTLTASPSTVFYSNSFNGEDRSQAKDRIHRIGMDTNRGATIFDLVHLDIDQYILDNLERKRRLEDLTMGIINEELKSTLNRD